MNIAPSNNFQKQILALFVVSIIWGISYLDVPGLYAQSSGVVVTHVATQEQDDQLSLDVFFAVVDGNRRPLSGIDIDAATIELLGGDNRPVDATVQKPQTPFYIALLLDGSGSMVDLIGAVREAAQSALGDAPPNARFAVFKFNELGLEEPFLPVEDFTNDLNLVARSIDAVQADAGAPTCLYNALYKAIEILEQQIQGPQERRAIIVFTDGKDTNRNLTGPCSQRTFDDVIFRSTRNSTSITPIHTIGLCEDDRCANLNSGELQTMSKETLGFSAIGNQTNLGGLFQEIMDGLNSQWVASTNVCTRQGAIEAVLKAQLRETAFTPAPFTFISAQNCRPPVTPPDADVTSIRYDSQEDRYYLALNLTSADQIQRLIVNVWDDRGGTQVSNDLSFFQPETTLTVELSTEGLIPGREYRVQVLAEDARGLLFEKPQERSTRRDILETILAVANFVYEPPEAPPPASAPFAIEPPTPPDWRAGTLTLELSIAADDLARVDTYEGYISDEAGQKIQEFGPQSLIDSQIELELPNAMRQSRGDKDFSFFIELRTTEGVPSTATYEGFVVTRPGLFGRARIWIGQNPNTVWTIVGFLISCAVVGVLIYNRQDNKKKDSEVRPPLEPPTEQGGAEKNPADHNRLLSNQIDQFAPHGTTSSLAGSGQMRLRVEITRSPGQLPVSESGLGEDIEPRTTTVVHNFPCVLGRDEYLDQLEMAIHGSKQFLNIAGDERISRGHAEITIKKGEFYLTDLESRNGTYVENRKLESGKPKRLSGFTLISLGRRTFIELEPEIDI